MPESLYALAFLACPLGMGLMMWMMLRGHKAQPAEAESSAAKQAELTRLQAEIELLRRHGHNIDAERQPSSS